MTQGSLRESILSHLPYTPNAQQSQLIDVLARFVVDDDLQSTVFMLNGYAGTGKTSLTAALVNALEDFGIKAVLLAPTGRAAKVFGNFSHHPAYTIHRHIYRSDLESGSFTSIKENKARNGTIFIVDESSMIDTSDNMSRTINLLDDLLQFVYSGHNTRLIFLGDPAQLPPVNSAADEGLYKALRRRFFHVIRAVLTSTVRQSAHSGILYNATWLRRAMHKDIMPAPKIFVSMFDDVDVVEGADLADELQKCYSRYGMEETIIITRSNKRAVDYNIAVRNTLLEYTRLLSRGDMVMVAKNNYFWTKKVKGLEFIANGDMGVIEKVNGWEEFAGMEFADVELCFPDHDDITIEAKANISGLVSDAPALSNDQMRNLTLACMDNPEVYAPGTPDTARVVGLRNDPFYNALQLKYGYAVTCHKAQGGQWKAVFIDMGFLPDDSGNKEFYRWLYTAVTRASEKLYFVNPSLEVL